MFLLLLLGGEASIGVDNTPAAQPRSFFDLATGGAAVGRDAAGKSTAAADAAVAAPAAAARQQRPRAVAAAFLRRGIRALLLLFVSLNIAWFDLGVYNTPNSLDVKCTYLLPRQVF